METDEPPNVDAPAPIPYKAFLESSEPEAEDDHHKPCLRGEYRPKPTPRLGPR